MADTAENPVAYMVFDYTDEVSPVQAPTLGAWAEWLSKPDLDWDREEPAADGQTFRVTRTEVAGSVRAKYLGEGKWLHAEPPPGCDWFAVLAFSGPFGWDAENSYDSFSGLLGLCADDGEPGAAALDPGEVLEIVCTRTLPERMAVYHFVDGQPSLTILEGPEGLTRDQLVDEVRYWREEAAAFLDNAVIRDGLAAKRGRSRASRLPLLRQIGNTAELLQAPLAGETSVESCDICGQPIKIGDPCYQDVDLGSVHARCCGPEREAFVNLGTHEPLAPGEPIPEPFPHTALYTDAQMANQVAKALAYVTKQKVRRPWH